jgi:phosphoglycerol transferase
MNDNFKVPMDARLKACWCLSMAALFLYFGMRYTGMNAVVMADEWYYSSLSRLTAPADISIPSYLYTVIYHATTACGPGYLDCARWLNAFFFLGSAPFIYLVGRRFLDTRLASFVALLAMIGPVNSYTAYFMPESIYFFTFWVTSWIAFRFHERPDLAHATTLGVCVGALALLKLHALFLVPSILAFMLYSIVCRHGTGPAAWRSASVCTVSMILVTVLVRMGFGYIVAGPNGLSLSGSLYAAQAGNSTGQSVPVLELIQLALFNLRGHVEALTILFGMPIAALVAHAFARCTGNANVRSSSPLAVYTALILLALLGMTVAFTAFVAGSGYETNARLHMRYYNFALPLLVIVGASQVRQSSRPGRWVAMAVAAAVAAMILFTIVTSWQPYTPSLVDSPDFRGMSMRRAAFYILGLLALCSVVSWARNASTGARLFLFGFMPLFALSASLNIDHEVRAGGASNKFDRAGKFTHQFLTEAQRGQLGIIGTDPSGMFRTRFHIDNIHTWQQTAPQNLPLDLNGMPPDTAWLLLLGDYALPAGATIRARASDYVLIELGRVHPLQSATP